MQATLPASLANVLHWEVFVTPGITVVTPSGTRESVHLKVVGTSKDTTPAAKPRSRPEADTV
jgi:hypothetical protein